MILWCLGVNIFVGPNLHQWYALHSPLLEVDGDLPPISSKISSPHESPPSQIWKLLMKFLFLLPLLFVTWRAHSSPYLHLIAATSVPQRRSCLALLNTETAPYSWACMPQHTTDTTLARYWYASPSWPHRFTTDQAVASSCERSCSPQRDPKARVMLFYFTDRFLLDYYSPLYSSYY